MVERWKRKRREAVHVLGSECNWRLKSGEEEAGMRSLRPWCYRGPRLLPTVMSGSEVQQQLGSVLMSEAQITTKGHAGSVVWAVT